MTITACDDVNACTASDRCVAGACVGTAVDPGCDDANPCTGGTSWTPVNSGLTATDVRALAINPATPTTLYAGTFGGGAFVFQIACADGIVDGSEQCDDGNTASGDACSATCTIEPGWTCSGQPSVCTRGGCVVNSFSEFAVETDPCVPMTAGAQLTVRKVTLLCAHGQPAPALTRAGGAASRPATSPTPPAGARARRARRWPADGPSVSRRAAPAATRAAPAATHPGRRTASTRPA